MYLARILEYIIFCVPNGFGDHGMCDDPFRVACVLERVFYIRDGVF